MMSCAPKIKRKRATATNTRDDPLQLYRIRTERSRAMIGADLGGARVLGFRRRGFCFFAGLVVGFHVALKGCSCYRHFPPSSSFRLFSNIWNLLPAWIVIRVPRFHCGLRSLRPRGSKDRDGQLCQWFSFSFWGQIKLLR